MSEPIEQADAVVIGAGVIGCAIAWRLGQAGLRVVAVERGRIGGEACRINLAPFSAARFANRQAAG